MNITYCRDQAECILVLAALNLSGKISPLKGSDGCDGITQLSNNAWLIISNERGVYTMIVLEDCTKAEAWAFFDSVGNKHGWKTHSPRAVFADGNSPSVN